MILDGCFSHRCVKLGLRCKDPRKGDDEEEEEEDPAPIHEVMFEGKAADLVRLEKKYSDEAQPKVETRPMLAAKMKRFMYVGLVSGMDRCPSGYDAVDICSSMNKGAKGQGLLTPDDGVVHLVITDFRVCVSVCPWISGHGLLDQACYGADENQ